MQVISHARFFDDDYISLSNAASVVFRDASPHAATARHAGRPASFHAARIAAPPSRDAPISFIADFDF